MLTSAWPDLSGLASLAHERQLDLSRVLLRVQTDLFVTASARDGATIRAFTSLAAGLLERVDADTAARVARKLSLCPDTPESLLDLLVRRGGEARRAVAELAPRLPHILADAVFDAELSEDLAEALASRPDLGGRALDHLASLADDGVDFALAMNRGVMLRGLALDWLTTRARSRPALAQALLRRADLTAGEEALLYLQADAAQRARIRGRLEASASLRFPTVRRADAAETEELLRLAKAGQVEDFGGRLAQCLGLGTAPDWRFHHPARQDLLALGLAAAGVPGETAIEIFLTLEPRIAESVHAVFDLAGIVRTVPQPVAASLVEATLGVALGQQRPGRHQPATDASGAFVRAGAGIETDRRPATDRSRRTNSGS